MSNKIDYSKHVSDMTKAEMSALIKELMQSYMNVIPACGTLNKESDKSYIALLDYSISEVDKINIK